MGWYGMAYTSLVLGIIMLFTWPIAIAGLPVSVTGSIIGIMAIIKKEHPLTAAIAGVILCIAGLVASSIVFSIYLQDL